MKEVARQIKNLRKERGLTQTQLAARIGMNQANISKWEQDDNEQMTMRSLMLLAQGLGASVHIELRKNECQTTTKSDCTDTPLQERSTWRSQFLTRTGPWTPRE